MCKYSRVEDTYAVGGAVGGAVGTYIPFASRGGGGGDDGGGRFGLSRAEKLLIGGVEETS